MNNQKQIDRIKSCIWGAIVGDALGARYEFLSTNDVKEQLAKDLRDCKGRLELLGGGPFELAPGQMTDDGELMLSLLTALSESNNEYREDVVADYYLNWYHSEPFDIGKTTKQAFGDGARDYDEILESSIQNNKSSKSNGCLMRSMPLAIVALSNPQELIQSLARLDCPLTNPNEDCINAVEIYITTIALSILGESREDIYKRIYDLANDENKDLLIKAAKRQLPEASGSNMGYYKIALQNAFLHYFNRTHFEDAMIKTIQLGGDTDTNCCILGGLLATREKIPNRWIATVQGVTDVNHNRYDQLPYIIPSNIKKVILDVIHGL